MWRDRGHLGQRVEILFLACGITAGMFAPSYAFGTTWERTDTPGVMMTEEGSVIFADAIKTDMCEMVIEKTLAVGERIDLVGELGDGWGTVSFTWHHVDGDEVLRLLTDDLGAADDMAWKVEKEHTFQAQLPERNRAVVKGGSSQQCKIEAVSVGESAWCLTGSDETGYTHSIYWLIHVVPDANGRTALESAYVNETEGEQEALTSAAFPGLGLPAAVGTGAGTNAETSVMLVTRLVRDEDPQPEPEPEPEPDPEPKPNPQPLTPIKPADTTTRSTPSTQPASSSTKSNLPKTGEDRQPIADTAMLAAVILSAGLVLRRLARRRDTP